jgi:type VI secretion system protein ImpF
MAELAPRERLQPSLLDRLTDDAPDEQAEARERRVLSLRTLRESVLRDLAWLLNTTNLLSTTEVPAPLAARLAGSVVNYGMPDLSGVSVAGLEMADLERGIRQAIWDFEPRLIRATVSVRAVPAESDRHTIMFIIEGDMWAQPYPERLYLKTALDIDRAMLRLTEGAAA